MPIAATSACATTWTRWSSAIDEAAGPVVLVGHSGGGAIAHAAADARPDRVARVVYVDAGPLGAGNAINDGLPVVDGEIPLPDWSMFDEADLRDLDDDLRARFRARAVPEPTAVAYDAQVLNDERRYDVPATIIACEFPSEQLRQWIAEGNPYVAELAAMRDVEYVDLPTGHWPQFTKPTELGQAILAAISIEPSVATGSQRSISTDSSTAQRPFRSERAEALRLALSIALTSSALVIFERPVMSSRLATSMRWALLA